MENMTDQSASKASAAIGSMIFSVFGSGWLIVGTDKMFGKTPLLWAVVVLLGLSVFVVALMRYRRNRAALAATSTSPESKRAERVFNIVNIGQGIAIFIALNVANNLGHPEWFIPAFIFIVGAHFIPLAAVFKAMRHYVIGSTLMLLAVLYPLVASGGPANPVGCLGAGLVLWASAIAGLTSN
jgi:F0F1-type ATP synthase assembly protein I